MNQLTEAVVTIFAAIIGVTILAVLVSRNANTTGVIQALGTAFGSALGVATAPVTGAQVKPNLTYPTSPMGAFSGIGLGNLVQ